MAISGTVFELFDIEWYHDLEIWVRGHSRSFKMVPLGVVSYSPSTVTKALSWREACSVTEVEERIQGRSDGGYIGIYTPKISNHFVHVWDINPCFEIAMTS